MTLGSRGTGAVLALYCLALLFPDARIPLALVGALIAVAAGAGFKHALITRAAHNQGFSLPHLPVRGRSSDQRTEDKTMIAVLNRTSPTAANEAASGATAQSRRHADAYMFDAVAETMPREELARLQLRRLRQTLKNAFDNVPLHQRRLRARRIRTRRVALA